MSVDLTSRSQPKSVISTLYNDPSLSPPSPPACPPPPQDPARRRGGSPSSTMTIRRADASARVPIHADRSSSRLSRWLLELQTPDVLDLSDVDPIGTRSNPYLAYPHMNMAAVRRRLDDADSMHDYVVVDQDVAQESPQQDPPHDQQSHDSAPTDIASPRSTIRLINPPSSLRHFHFSKRSVSPSPRTSASRSPSRLSIFHRPSRSDLTSGASGLSFHSRNTSLQFSLPRNGPQSSGAPRISAWRWRPSVLGHFSSASISDAEARLSPGDSITDHSRSRPSMSSSNTCSSFTTPTTVSVHEDGESPVPSTPPSKPSSIFGSMRARSHARAIASQSFFKTDGGSASSPSLRALYPASAPHLPESQTTTTLSSPKSSSDRSSFMHKSRPSQTGGLDQIFVEEPGDSQPHVLFAGKSSGPRLSLPSLASPARHARKKRLVVSGIALNDTKRLDAIQKWCQSFGEIDQITRMPNGDLHINFQKAEVADTVCRVRAKVHIAGAGSVHLSWITGNKRR